MEQVRKKSYTIATAYNKQYRLRRVKYALIRDRSWFLFFYHLYVQPALRLSQKLLMQTLLHCCTLLKTGTSLRDFKLRHDCNFKVSPDFEVDAQSR